MKNWWLYIKFLINSSNQHGVHSPFVYALVVKCFYNNKNLEIYKKLEPKHKDFNKAKFLYRFVHYFKFDSVYYPENISSNFKSALSLAHGSKGIISYAKNFQNIDDFDKNQFIYLNNKSLENSSNIKNIIKQCSNNSIIIIENIRQTPNIFKQWKELKSSTFVRVSIDTFDWGILCFRKEQHKEHFVIRI